MAESTVNWTPIILVGVGYFILKDLFIEEEEEETKKIEKIPLARNPFSYATFVVPPKKVGFYRISIYPKTIVDAAKTINGGFGVMYDDEAQIMAGVKMAGTKTDIKVIAKYMNTLYKYDVYEKFKKNLSKKEVGRINKYVLKLPNYKSSGYLQGDEIY